MEYGRVKHHSIEIVAHQELTEADLSELRQLFDSEYLKEFGEWDPQPPYGYGRMTSTSWPRSKVASSITWVGRAARSLSVRRPSRSQESAVA